MSDQRIALTAEDFMKMFEQSNEEQETPKSEAEHVERLRRIQELKAPQYQFEPGQIIRHRYPKESNQKNAAVPHIFVRYLHKPIDMAQRLSDSDDVAAVSNAAHQSLAAFKANALIGVIMDGRAYIEYLLNADDFEPHPDFS